MANETPPLALSDIMHVMSPSPLPDEQSRPRSLSPEPLQDGDIQKFRKRVLEVVRDRANSVSPYERELADMVLRLAAFATSRPDPAQVVQQAEMILSLSEQRNFLVREAEEQRARWEGEKEGWTRMAEALIAQQSKGDGGIKEEELERQVLNYECDNKALRQKLTDTQSRLTALEYELTRLRPLLLMQPHSPVHITPTTHPDPPRSLRRRSRKGKLPQDVVAADDVEEIHVISDEEVEELDDKDPGPSHGKSKLGRDKDKPEYYRRPDQAHPPQAQRRSRKASLNRGFDSKKAPLLSDARSEHLLLALRRIGKERASYVANFVQAKEKKKEEEKQREEAEQEKQKQKEREHRTVASPKTPRRGTTNVTTPTQPSLTPGYLYLNSPGPHVLVPVPASAYHVVQTPNANAAASTSHIPQSDQQSQPQTPLDSLLSAARHISQTDNSRRGKVRSVASIDLPETPVPKRRKVTSTVSVLSLEDTEGIISASAGTAGVNRVMSALDVLADQAAVFSSKEHVQDGVSVTKGKGKANGTRSAVATPTTNAQTKPKGKGRAKGGSKIADKNSSRARTQSSRPHPPPLESPGDTGRRKSNVSPTWGHDLDPAAPSPVQDDETLIPERTNGTAEIATQLSPVDEPPGAPILAASHVPPTISDSQPQPSLLSLTLAPPIALSRSQSEDRANDSREYMTHDPPHTLERVAAARRAASIPLKSGHDTTSFPIGPTSASHTRRESAPAITAVGRHVSVSRVASQDAETTSSNGKRPRSPYVKWSKEEDDLLAQAVAKHGQKWDLVQKALPSRGYHQVRQRWLRKLGVFDSKPDLSSFQTGGSRDGDRTAPAGGSNGREPPPAPKLGLAPLSSELVYGTFSRGSTSGAGHE